MRKARCFVAIAVDRGDTDALYNSCIEPILKRNNVIPVVISRRQSNDDLNNQIIDQLNLCDFCIADLTYARPSVYFEAGYSQRSVPVIYTVRKDHLGRHQPDDGRVHFDLQMKPLITWAATNDARFRVRLDRRLKSTVLRQWRRQRAADAAVQRDRERFTALPITDRLARLRRTAIRRCRMQGFALWRVGVDRAGPYKDPGRFVQSSNLFVGAYRRRRLVQIVTVQAFDSINSTALKQLGSTVYSASALVGPFESDLQVRPNSLSQVSLHRLVVSLRPVPRGRIEAALPHVGRAGPAHYVGQGVVFVGDYRTSAPVPLNVNLHVFADLKCEGDLGRQLEVAGNAITAARRPNTAMKPAPTG